MPISFTCPHCGAQTNVADQYAGQTGPCARCGKTITVPAGLGQPYDGPAPIRQGPGWGLVIGIIAVVGLVMLLVCAGLMLPVIQDARERARRMQCVNNMKQLGLAVLNFESAHGRFPTYVDPNAPEGQPTSWRVQVLPYYESNPRYQQYDPNQAWDSPTNAAMENPMPSLYQCPSNRNASAKPLDTDYLAVVGPGTIIREKKAATMRDVTDGTSNTILLIESHPSGIHWMKPADVKAADFTPSGPSPLKSAHVGVANVIFADGSVQTLSNRIDPTVLKALTTANGGEQVNSNTLD